MKKVVAFLLALIIFVAPVTTLVKADVVIGDNDNIIVNENAKVLGRKLALMESIPNLLNNGVTNLTISNTEDLDTYLDSLWEELGDAVDYLNSGDWVEDIPESFRNEALQNINNYLSYVDNRTNYFADLLRNPATTLLKTYVIGNNLPKVQYKPYFDTLNTFKKLARINTPLPSPSPDPNYAQYIEKLNGDNGYGFFWVDFPLQLGNYHNNYYPANSISYVGIQYSGTTLMQIATPQAYTAQHVAPCTEILTLNIVGSGNNYTGTIGSFTQKADWLQWNNYRYGVIEIVKSGNTYTWGNYGSGNTNNYVFGAQVRTGTLTEVFEWFSTRFRNINVYVNGNAWSLVNYTPQLNPTLDIDGTLKIYGDDNTPQYDIKNGTQIDYDVLYDTIYNAIINALPIGQQDITYYDSHDTIYSPTIINNYGEEEGQESDLIDTILDYSVIPKFDTAIAQPMRQALTNGVLIMNNSITNVIPNEILLILGACFFLLLFAVVINRMIK